MSLFQCQRCGCVENTALASQGFAVAADRFDWTGIEDRKGLLLCSVCGPTKFRGGTSTEYGREWHGRFPRRFLPLAMFRTAKNGNLEHVETGEQDYRKYEIAPGVAATQALSLTEEEREHIHQAIDKLGDYEHLRPELRMETSRTRGVLQKLFRFLPARAHGVGVPQTPKEN